MSRIVRQDYIARIRYQNSLPPPPCPPKLLSIPVSLTDFTTAEFLSGLVQQQPLNVDIDSELGMPIDMSIIGGVFDKGDESQLYPEKTPRELHPTDKLLLRDLAALSGSLKSQPGVSFLRRTEYISSDAVKQARALARLDSSSSRSKPKAELSDPLQQVHRIEETFRLAAEDADLTGFSHPTKTGLKVEQSWTLQPDVELFDLTYLLMKMAGGAPGVTEKDETSDPRYDVAIARPIGTAEKTFMSLFLADKPVATEFKGKISESNDLFEDQSALDTESDGKVYRFEYSRDYEVTTKSTDTISIGLDSESRSAYFHPIARDLVLKRRRQIQQDVVNRRNKEPEIENDVSAIEIIFRPFTGEESVDRDSIRKQEFGYIE
ncbi:RNA polymerase II-associated [Lipomyces oligophaga]|uniref:RNA polymerase II-associated n=1 Tax=Lipomyces oligophaga TaxID=45792 RepID=UPI0034D00B6D